jgi:hypothetical protein
MTREIEELTKTLKEKESEAKIIGFRLKEASRGPSKATLRQLITGDE